MDRGGGGGGGGALTHLPLMLMFSTLPKPKITGSRKQKLWAKYRNQTNRIFTLVNVNHKYITFQANY